jgi:hypothetical protein
LIGSCSEDARDTDRVEAAGAGDRPAVIEAGCGTDRVAATSGKWAFGQDPLVPAVIWVGTKGLATSPQIRPPTRQPIVPVRYKP